MTVVGVRDTEKETIEYSPEGTYSDLCAVITNLYQSPTKKGIYSCCSVWFLNNHISNILDRYF